VVALRSTTTQYSGYFIYAPHDYKKNPVKKQDQDITNEIFSSSQLAARNTA
jgi:hypothetical protein